MTLTASSAYCDRCHTLKCGVFHYRGLTLAKRGWIWNTLVNGTSKVKSNKTPKAKLKPNCVTPGDYYTALTIFSGSCDLYHTL